MINFKIERKRSEMKLKQILALFATLFMIFFVSGCAQKGEKEAEKLVKDACVSPDSFQKIDYKVDEKNGLAYLDFKAKNAMGVWLQERAYFKLSSNSISGINTLGLDKNTLNEFLKKDPKNFESAVNSYRELQKIAFYDDAEIEIFLEQTKDLKYNKDNYFSWTHLQRDSEKYNSIIKKYKDIYNQAPEVVKQKVKAPPKFAVITVNGTYRGPWDANLKWVDDYPEAKK